MRVVELAHIMSGPVCGMMLADMGADVIKVEKAPDGDDSRRFQPMLPCGESAAFMIVNRNKRGIALDLKSAEGREILLRLLANADVVTENYRKGTMEKFGLGYDTLSQLYPGLIYCSISGFGRTGPMADHGGFDLIAQGMCGLMSTTGEPGQDPIKSGSPVTDINAGILAALGILAAYSSKLKTGLGQVVDTSLFEAGLQQMFWPAAGYFFDGSAAPKMGSANSTSAPYQVFKSKDGWINVGAANQVNYERLLKILNAPELATDARFNDNNGRMANREELVQILTAHFVTRNTQDWIKDFEAAGLPAGPVMNVPEALNHPQTLARNMVVESDHPTAGTVRGLGLPIRFSNSERDSRKAAPLLGQHTAEVLREVGYSDAEIAMLARKQTIIVPPSATA